MLVLAIHTAGPACELALRRADAVLANSRDEMRRGQDARLPDLVQTLLADAKVELEELDRIAVLTGPGSFTGIRVGVAFARGLALALNVPCIGVTTLEAALPAGQQGSAMVALSAQKRLPDVTFWTQTFRTGIATGPATERSVDDLNALLQARPHMLYGETDALAQHIPAFAAQPAMPTAERAAAVAAGLDPYLRLARPTYARDPDATPAPTTQGA